MLWSTSLGSSQLWNFRDSTQKKIIRRPRPFQIESSSVNKIRSRVIDQVKHQGIRLSWSFLESPCKLEDLKKDIDHFLMVMLVSGKANI